jgi:hypothetical protein
MAEKLKMYGWEFIVVDFLWYSDGNNPPEKMTNPILKANLLIVI